MRKKIDFKMMWILKSVVALPSSLNKNIHSKSSYSLSVLFNNTKEMKRCKIRMTRNND